jgi:dihydroorotate dehydrogenase electron transfer subunit
MSSAPTCEQREYLAPKPSEIVSNRRIGPGWYVLRLREPTIARLSQPGMFVQVLCAEDGAVDPLLRRPFSVYCVDEKDGTYDILYTTVGRGTRWMAALQGSETADSTTEETGHVDVLGPLGNTFRAPLEGDHIYLVGGGVGVAPLYFLALRLLASPNPPSITFCMGARTSDFLQGIEDFRSLPIRTEVATDDGSEGFRGRVTGLFTDLLQTRSREGADPESAQIYGCGPQGMNEALRSLAVEHGLRCQICLESLMGCGFGICFGCVAPIRSEVGGEYTNRRICWEGPVFDASLLSPGIEG